MTDRILVPFDGSALSERALEHAVTTFPDATITTVYVVDPIDSIVDVEAGGLPVAEDWHERARERAAERTTNATERASEEGIVIEADTAVGRPAREILRYADEHAVDQIVMGSHGREGIERTILGSVAETVLRRSKVPVTIVR